MSPRGITNTTKFLIFCFVIPVIIGLILSKYLSMIFVKPKITYKFEGKKKLPKNEKIMFGVSVGIFVGLLIIATTLLLVPANFGTGLYLFDLKISISVLAFVAAFMMPVYGGVIGYTTKIIEADYTKKCREAGTEEDFRKKAEEQKKDNIFLRFFGGGSNKKYIRQCFDEKYLEKYFAMYKDKVIENKVEQQLAFEKAKKKKKTSSKKNVKDKKVQVKNKAVG